MSAGTVDPGQIRALREQTGAGILDCRNALTEAKGNQDEAVRLLREKGLAAQAKRGGQVAAEGQVGAYVHTGGKIGVLIEVNCVTDFAARSPEFQELVRDLAMQVAASAPRYVGREEVPERELAVEREIFAKQARESGKPEAVIDKIVAGKLEKFYQDVCLLEQPFIKQQDKTVSEIVSDIGLRIREKLSVLRFVRYQLGEGVERAEQDFAGEVAAQVAAAAHEAKSS